ncbi:MAG TPA: chemotaxis protein CheW, partial [Syntrophomonadaceae bacterium]|nr:chemotaxis protein CheW [Syntrophomonadaceae bacterium]
MSIESAFSSDEVQLVTFIVGQESFGLDIMNVQEVIRMPAITSVPQAPGYVDGMTNLRGHILPVIDTRTKFGMERMELSESSRVIVVDIGGKAVGLNVDSVSEVLRVDSGNIENAPASLSENVDSSSI